MSKTINYEGVKVTYDDSAINKWSICKKLAFGGKETLDAIDTILCGKSDEVAEKLGDDISKMNDLLERIVTISGNAGKN